LLWQPILEQLLFVIFVSYPNQNLELD